MKQIASHQGVVTDTRKGSVSVKIEAVSACASCAAHSKCGFAESKDKTVDVPTPDWQSYSNGEEVTVHIDEQHGMLAVWIAYVLPALLIIAVIVALSLTGWPEWAVVLAAFATLGIYVAVLYLCRRKVEKNFTLTVTHNATPE